MNKIVAYLTLGMLALLVLGIAGCPTTTTTAVGTQGIEMSFVENAPPVSVNVNQDFPIYVDILNKGGSYINPGAATFYFSGVGYDLKNVERAVRNTQLLSKESTVPERLYFAKNARWTTALQNAFSLPLILTSCYNYGTVAQVDVCVSNKNSSTICSISGEKVGSGSNSAAPLQITSVTESLTGNKLQLTLLVENKGISKVATSHVYLADADCDKLLQAEGNFEELQKENKVKVSIRAGSEPGWTCKLQSSSSPFVPTSALDGAITLEPVGKIVCEKLVTSEETHVMPLTVSLLYRYVDYITQTIRINPA